jgi:hypothetical protein
MQDEKESIFTTLQIIQIEIMRKINHFNVGTKLNISSKTSQQK